MRKCRLSLGAWAAAGMLALGMLLCGAGTDKEDYPVITMAFIVNEEQMQDLPVVEAEINKLTRERAHAGFRMLPISESDSQTDRYLMKIKDGQVDLVNVRSILEEARKGMILPMDDLLKEYGGDILELLDEEALAAGRLDEIQYGVPRLHEWAQSYGVCMRKDLLEKYDISWEDIHSVEDFEAVLAAVCGKEPGITGVAPLFMTRMDPLFDSVGVLLSPETSNLVSNYYESQEFIREAEKFREWAQKGYLSQAGFYYQPRTKMQLQEMMRAGQIFSYFVRYKPGIDVQESNITGQELAAVRLTEPLLSSDDLSMALVGINSQCENPEAAMRVLSLLYTDSEIANLICWGIEGEHYVKNGDGTITYPKGVTAANTRYNFNRNWQLPNQYLAYVWQGDSTGLGEEVARYNEEAAKSVAFGFYFDASDVKLERDRCKEVAEAYLEGFLKGEFDLEKILPVFWQDLRTAGIDKVINEKQRQLNNFIQNSGS